MIGYIFKMIGYYILGLKISQRLCNKHSFTIMRTNHNPFHKDVPILVHTCRYCGYFEKEYN